MTETRSSIESRNKMAGMLIIGGSLLLAAASVAELVYRWMAPPHQAHPNLGDLGRAVIPGMSVFLLGGIFLINRADAEDAAPETLPWLQRPRVRRRLAVAYFALGAVLVFVSVYRGP